MIRIVAHRNSFGKIVFRNGKKTTKKKKKKKKKQNKTKQTKKKKDSLTQFVIREYLMTDSTSCI